MSQIISTDKLNRILTSAMELHEFGVATVSPTLSIVTYFPRNDAMYEIEAIINALKIMLGKTPYKVQNFTHEFVPAHLDGQGTVKLRHNGLSHYRIMWQTRHPVDDRWIDQEIKFDGQSMLCLDANGLHVYSRPLFESIWLTRYSGTHGVVDADKQQGDWLEKNGSNLFSRFSKYVYGF